MYNVLGRAVFHSLQRLWDCQQQGQQPPVRLVPGWQVQPEGNSLHQRCRMYQLLGRHLVGRGVHWLL